jgi:putative polyhydroxyalkanoate system protein
MRIAVPHNTDKQTARQKIDDRLKDLLVTYGHYLSEVEQRWEGDRLVFAGKTKGMKANGSVEVTDNEIIIDGKVPLLARPFEPRIKNTIEREAAAMFSTRGGPSSGAAGS